MIDYERIKQTKIEDIIFIIYYFIITLSLYSNHIERKYLYTNNNKDKEIYRSILLIIFIIALLVYIYYTYSNIKDYNQNKTYLKRLSLIASILVLISGIIYLYIIIKDENLDIELAFN